MHKSAAFLFALLFAAQAQAAIPRCGTDDFGNRVCMDKDGVVSTSRPDPGSEAKKPAAPAESTGAATGKPSRDSESNRPRCVVDPFGNTVCR